MPRAERMRWAGSPSFTARISGMPPSTAAWKPSMWRLRRASSKSSGPWWASSALLAVTTCLPAARARRMKVRAGSSPPTSSITTRISGSSRTRPASAWRGSRLMSSPSRGRVTSRSAMAAMARRQPARSVSSAPWLWRMRTTPAPTVPRPSRPILMSFIASPSAPARSPRGEALEAAERLLDALLVLHEGEADEALSVLAEADARRHRDLAVLDQHLRELERAHSAKGLGDGRPHEHGPLGLLHLPADLVEPVDERVAPLAVHLVDLAHDLLVALEGHDAGDLDGLEHAVVEVGLHPRQGVDHLAVAAAEGQAPARHVVGLRGREELHAHVLGAGHLEEGRRRVAVEVDVRVGEVVHHHEAVLLGEVHDLDEEVPVHAERGRVVGEREDQELGLRPGQPRRLREPREEVLAGHQGHGAKVTVRDHHRVGMDRVGGVGYQGAVS